MDDGGGGGVGGGGAGGGGIAGVHAGGILENGHWNLEGLNAGGEVDSDAVVTGCAALTEAPYADPANYPGWDFKRTWRMEGGMPALRVFGEPMALTGVTAVAASPWDVEKQEGFIELSFQLSEDLGLTGGEASLRVTATDLDTGETWAAAAAALSGDTGTAAGAHAVRWNWLAQGIAPGATNVAFRVEYTWREKALYCVADLSGGKDAESYPVEYLPAEPEGGFNRDEFKTEKLALRRIDPANDWNGGVFKLEGRFETTLTNAYYIGVFETTQRQWELVAGRARGHFENAEFYATRPAEMVDYVLIRGENEGADWPASGAVDADSFAGKLRARTGLGFDLPTEAQWEFACRAGTETDFNNGKDQSGGGDRDEALEAVGRYRGNSGAKGSVPVNCGTNLGTAAVGSYAPNRWGLYDMHGNVEEWCLDWYAMHPAGGVEPAGPATPEHGERRVLRGGAWNSPPTFCTSAYRGECDPDGDGDTTGVRLCVPGAGESWVATTACSGESAGVAVVPEYAEQAGETTWTYRTEPGETNAAVTLTGSPSASGALAVPESLGGLPVTGIAAGAFANCEGLTELWIPDSVESVGEGAFAGSGLTTLSVPGAWRNAGVLALAGVPEGCQVVYRDDEPLRITAIGVGSNAVSLSFDREASGVCGTDDLTGDWKAIPNGDFTLEGKSATIPLEKAYRFLRAE